MIHFLHEYARWSISDEEKTIYSFESHLSSYNSGHMNLVSCDIVLYNVL